LDQIRELKKEYKQTNQSLALENLLNEYQKINAPFLRNCLDFGEALPAVKTAQEFFQAISTAAKTVKSNFKNYDFSLPHIDSDKWEKWWNDFEKMINAFDSLTKGVSSGLREFYDEMGNKKFDCLKEFIDSFLKKYDLVIKTFSPNNHIYAPLGAFEPLQHDFDMEKHYLNKYEFDEKKAGHLDNYRQHYKTFIQILITAREQLNLFEDPFSVNILAELRKAITNFETVAKDCKTTILSVFKKNQYVKDLIASEIDSLDQLTDFYAYLDEPKQHHDLVKLEKTIKSMRETLEKRIPSKLQKELLLFTQKLELILNEYRRIQTDPAKTQNTPKNTQPDAYNKQNSLGTQNQNQNFNQNAGYNPNSNFVYQPNSGIYDSQFNQGNTYFQGGYNPNQVNSQNNLSNPRI